MRKLKITIISLIISVFLGAGNIAFADTIYLKNGSVMDGVIEQETDTYIKINLGFGLTKLHKSRIKKIERSTEDIKMKMQEAWQDQAEQRKIKHAKQKVEAQQRQKEKLFKKQVKKEQQRVEKKQEKAQKEAIKYIKRRNSVGVKAIINYRYEVELLVDTGATAVFINSSTAKKIGLEGKSFVNTYATLADGSSVSARKIDLDSLKVGDMEAKDVTAVFLREGKGVDGWDGLLGMSFLKRFIFRIDADNKKLILEKKIDE